MKYTSKERRNRILDRLHQTGKILIKECAEHFDVSEVSIRNDMAFLEGKGLLIRVKGGAIAPIATGEEDDLPIKSKELAHSAEKKAIGKAAAALVKEGETIILDAGTTTLEIARNLGDVNNITIITNAVNVAMELARYPGISVIMLGGHMRHVSLSITGMSAESSLQNYSVDKLFLGVDSYDLQKGISTPSSEEASLNRIMMECAGEVIAVSDSSKFSRRGFARICGPFDVNTLVTDSGIDEHVSETLRRAGVKVIIANV